MKFTKKEIIGIILVSFIIGICAGLFFGLVVPERISGIKEYNSHMTTNKPADVNNEFFSKCQVIGIAEDEEGHVHIKKDGQEYILDYKLK